MSAQRKRSLLFFLLGFALCFVAYDGRAAAPMQWSVANTYYGPTANPVTLFWLDKNEPAGDWYEVKVTWFERPSKTVTRKFLPADVTRVKQTTAPNAPWYLVSYKFKSPGQGHFIFEVRTCFNDTTKGCTSFTSSLSPSEALVNGTVQPWWVYWYLEAPGGVVPLP